MTFSVLAVEQDLALRLGSDLRVDWSQVGLLAGSEVERVRGMRGDERLDGLRLRGVRFGVLLVLAEHV